MRLNWKGWRRIVPISLACAISASGCGTDRGPRLQAAAERAAAAGAVEAAAQTGEARAALPELPGDCRRTERAGVAETDRVDAALVRYDAALGRQNDRGRRCAAWYDETRTRHSPQHGGGR